VYPNALKRRNNHEVVNSFPALKNSSFKKRAVFSHSLDKGGGKRGMKDFLDSDGRKGEK